MDDLDDHMLDQNEMNDVFSRPLGQDTAMSDADLESGKDKTNFLPSYCKKLNSL